MDNNKNSILEMFKMTYPKELVDGQKCIKYNKNFYKKENLLPKLDYINKNMTEVYNNSTEKDKNYLFYILISRLKELYCSCEEFEKVLNVEKSKVPGLLDYFIQEKIQKIDIPLIINEAYSILKTKSTLDDKIFNVLKKFSQDIIDNNISVFPPIFTAYIDDNTHFCIEYEEDHLDAVVIETCKLLALNNEINILEKFVFLLYNLLMNIMALVIVKV